MRSYDILFLRNIKMRSRNNQKNRRSRLTDDAFNLSLIEQTRSSLIQLYKPSIDNIGIHNNETRRYSWPGRREPLQVGTRRLAVGPPPPPEIVNLKINADNTQNRQPKAKNFVIS